MLAIRMQRTGRKGHAQFRVVVQDSHRTPTSGKIVAGLGHYDPHTKVAVVDKEKASFYLEHGAQPSDRVVQLLTREGIALPAWVTASTKKSKATRHSDKLRKNRPAEPKAEAANEPAEASTDTAKPTETADIVDENTTKKTETAAAEKPEAEAPKGATEKETKSEKSADSTAEEAAEEDTDTKEPKKA